jgi:putative phosphoribosyl transferase
MKARESDSRISLPFLNRIQAGRLLSAELLAYRNHMDVVVLGLPRGGLPVAYEIARALGAPMDALLVRKLGVPGQRELAFGAIAIGGVRVLDNGIISELGLTPQEIEETAAEEQRVLEAGNWKYRQGRPAPQIHGRIVIATDDGIATGSTMRAAVQALRSLKASRVVVATPVASIEAVSLLRNEADEVVCLAQPDPFQAVGYWYRDFSQVSDEEARWLLEKSTRVPAA